MKLIKYKFFVVLFVMSLLLALPGCEKKEYNGEAAELDFVESIKDTMGSGDAAGSNNVAFVEKLPEDFVTLTHRAKGETVGKVQKRLIELNYLHSEVTGYYGDATEKAVLQFQKVSGIDETGDVDEQTFMALMSSSAKKCKLLLTGIIIGIDAGCQRHSNHDKEPVAPNSKVMKNKATTGVSGKWSGQSEYDINMTIAKLLQESLSAQGAIVYMTHEDTHVDMSNIERAKFLTENNAMLSIVLRCNSANDKDTHGAFCMIPEASVNLAECQKAADAVLSAYCRATDAKNLGVKVRDDQTILNWCDETIICLELGHMSNRTEDLNLSDASYQSKMVAGITDGIIDYISNK